MPFLRLVAISLLAIGSLAAAETLKVTQPTSLAVERGAVGLRPGHELLLLGRQGDNLEVMFRNVSGTIPITATNFSEGVAYESFAGTLTVEPGKDTPRGIHPPSTAARAHTANKVEKPHKEPSKGARTPRAEEPKERKPEKAPEKSRVAERPTTNYGKMVKKAEKVAKEHEKAQVDGTAEVVAP